ncbi:MAG: tetratricopeptide repeat protein [Candidatus Omnitrophica bacterium]|nr:tetratricopeptide repeat protein [Candidatus Omnitrophota bacterium]
MEHPALRRLASVGVACLLVLPQFDAFPAGLRDDAVTYRTEGYEHQRQGDFTGAMAAYQKAAALDPAYPTPHNDMGILYEQMGQLEDAKRAYEQALTIDPNYLEAHANLAMLYERLGEKDQAVAHWFKRHQLGEPSDPWTARAEERLVALGAIDSYPGLKGKIYSRRHVIQQELEAHEQSREEFHILTEQNKRWP